MALRKRSIALIAIMLLLFAVMAIAAITFLNGNIYSTVENVDIEGYPVTGIDVSAHNGEVDFQKAKTSGIDFVFVKATEGATFNDSQLARNISEARAAGLKVGVYHFFRFNVDGAVQAKNLLKAVAGKPLDLPLVVDVESHSNPYSPADKVTRKVHDMVDHLTSYGYPVIIYSNKNGFDKHIRDEFADCGMWLCSLSKPTTHKGWTFWQYSHKGSIPGIGSDVDLDIWHSNREQWKQYADSTAAAIATANLLYATINGN